MGNLAEALKSKIAGIYPASTAHSDVRRCGQANVLN